jgi:hypothetical protein
MKIPWNKGLRKSRIDCICTVCGLHFEEFKSGIKEGRGKFCSRICWKKNHKTWNKGLKGFFSGINSPHWKGGIPKCKECGINLSQRHSKNNLCRKCFLQSDIGRLHSISHLPEPKRGELNPLWRGGKGTERHRLRGQKEYIIWRVAVFTRDNYTCQKCGIMGKHLEAHHIKSWVHYPELRYAIDNGQTLCINCHRSSETWGYRVFQRKALG